MSFVNYIKRMSESTVAANVAPVNSKLSGSPERRKKPISISEDALVDNIIKQLNSSGNKVKLYTPTAFGIQLDFYKKPDVDEVQQIMKDNGSNKDVKVKGNSVFVEI